MAGKGFFEERESEFGIAVCSSRNDMDNRSDEALPSPSILDLTKPWTIDQSETNYGMTEELMNGLLKQTQLATKRTDEQRID
uniref:Uncharacterized protein n=1 Tax=Kalanchoe fedtschenkoi TaxID=63787 RepID=A0A7N0UEU1_KALFE